MEKEFYTVKEFAEAYGCSSDRVYEWLRTGKIRHRERLTRHASYRIPQAELARLKGEESQEVSVIQQPTYNKFDPIALKHREEHYEELASIAKSLLQGGLDNVLKIVWGRGEGQEDKYTIPNKGATSLQYDELSKEQLVEKLNQNITTILKEKDWFFRTRFRPHLISELPDELQGIPLLDLIIKEQPYKLIETLRVLVERRTFKGTCPGC